MAIETWVPAAKTPETWTAADAVPPLPPPPPPPTDPEVTPPVNTVLPTISGTVQTGQTVTASTGTWSNSPTGFIYAWYLDGVFTAVTANSFPIPSDAGGKALTVAVTASNAGGSVTATSATSTVVQPAPVNITPPQITGVFDINQTLTVSNGIWSNNPTGFVRQWALDRVAITGATGTTYAVRPTDRNGQLSCTVTATNTGGSTPATSASISPVVRYTAIPVII